MELQKSPMERLRAWFNRPKEQTEAKRATERQIEEDLYFVIPFLKEEEEELTGRPGKEEVP